ncbi:MAG: hypothetical protein ABL879_15295 [Devosia sp.]
MSRRQFTAARAMALEAAYGEVEALARSIQAMAGKRPEQAAPPDLAAAAEVLLVRAALALGLRRPPAVAAETYGGLAARLAQALAALTAFEAAHAPWDAKARCYAWRLDTGGTLPVQRLGQQVATAPKVGERPSDELRAQTYGLINRLREEAYEIGIAAGRAQADGQSVTPFHLPEWPPRP